MNPKQLFDFDDDRAVSPVIGVVLMLTATVIIGGVVASFVTGMGTGLNSAPQASIDFDYNGTNLSITHEGGATLAAEEIEVRSSEGGTIPLQAGDSISTGTVIADAEVNNSSTVRVVWTGENGDQTTPLAKWTGPDA